jgi:hypothetical protein
MVTTPNRLLATPPLENDEHAPLVPDERGIVGSQVFLGLWLVVPALLSGDMSTVLSVLQGGLNSTQHQVLVQQVADETVADGKDT